MTGTDVCARPLWPRIWGRIHAWGIGDSGGGCDQGEGSELQRHLRRPLHWRVEAGRRCGSIFRPVEMPCSKRKGRRLCCAGQREPPVSCQKNAHCRAAAPIRPLRAGDTNMLSWEHEAFNRKEWRYLRNEGGRPRIYDRFMANVRTKNHTDIIMPILASRCAGPAPARPFGAQRTAVCVLRQRRWPPLCP